MTLSATSLDAFDPLELLRSLAERGSTGLFAVSHPAGVFQAWLEGGRVQHLSFGAARGAEALARLLGDPSGHFHFEAGVQFPEPTLDVSLDDLLLEALETLPEVAPRFNGPARVTSPERLAHLTLTPGQREVVRRVEAGQPLLDLTQDPAARRLLGALSRMGLLAPRTPRVARLTVAVARGSRGGAVVDAVIWRRWQETLTRPLTGVAVRREDETVLMLPVRPGADLGTRLMVPPELLLHTGLRVGESVLVRPG